uniref:Uncharacterized protein n=1 Tax=Cacopsylla melanoneura TaxID=428564 RepID=A0A8D8ZBB4_9HEMI
MLLKRLFLLFRLKFKSSSFPLPHSSFPRPRPPHPPSFPPFPHPTLIPPPDPASVFIFSSLLLLFLLHFLSLSSPLFSTLNCVTRGRKTKFNVLTVISNALYIKFSQ